MHLSMCSRARVFAVKKISPHHTRV